MGFDNCPQFLTDICRGSTYDRVFTQSAYYLHEWVNRLRVLGNVRYDCDMTSGLIIFDCDGVLIDSQSQ